MTGLFSRKRLAKLLTPAASLRRLLHRCSLWRGGVRPEPIQAPRSGRSAKLLTPPLPRCYPCAAAAAMAAAAALPHISPRHGGEARADTSPRIGNDQSSTSPEGGEPVLRSLAA